jgi:hypothetical protein
VRTNVVEGRHSRVIGSIRRRCAVLSIGGEFDGYAKGRDFVEFDVASFTFQACRVGLAEGDRRAWSQRPALNRTKHSVCVVNFEGETCQTLLALFRR